MTMEVRHFVLAPDGAIREFSPAEAALIATGSNKLPEFAERRVRYLQVSWDDEAAAEKMPHAWTDGPQTPLLRRQLQHRLAPHCLQAERLANMAAQEVRITSFDGLTLFARRLYDAYLPRPDLAARLGCDGVHIGQTDGIAVSEFVF